jgi:cysteine desulfurase
MAKALELAVAEMPEENARQAALRDRLIERVLGEIGSSRLNGSRENRLPNNASFIFEGIEGESLIMRLSAMGIAASTGSACSSASLEPSHVLLAIGLPHEIAHGSCRMTVGRTTTKEDIDYAADALKRVVGELREMSPLWEASQRC